MDTQTILWIPTAHRKYAEKHGAKYDAKQSIWYVDGEIPLALVDYVPGTQRARDYTQESVPSCPRCGHAMIWIDAERPFWGCSNYKSRECCGRRRGDDSFRRSAKSADPKPIPHHALITSTFVRSIHLTRVLSLLHQCLKNNDRIVIWLSENRAEFKGKNALELMGTREGFLCVERFITETFSPLRNAKP